MDFDARSPTDRIYTSWSEHMDLDRYVSVYLASRRYAPSEHARNAVLACMARFPAPAPYRKTDMDFYLDRNLVPKAGPLLPAAR